MAYCSVADVKDYLDIESAGDDTLIEDLIEDAQQAIDTRTGRTFEASADATRYFTVGVHTRGRTLFLDEDLCAITSIVTNADDGSGGTALADADYFTLPRNDTPYYAIEIAKSSSEAWEYTDDPEAGIEVTGRWAYSTEAPNDIRRACIRWASYFYRQKDAQVFDTVAQPDLGIITIPQGIPADVERLLKPYVRAVFV